MNKSKKLCVGCRENFYNGNNPMGVQECWMYKSAQVRTRYRLSTNMPMDQREGYVKTSGLNCYNEKGYVFLKDIPHYAK